MTLSRFRTLLALVVLAGPQACVPGLAPVGPESPVASGQILLEAGRYAEARDLFRMALQLSPRNPQALLGLGAAFEALDELDSARSVYATLAAERLPGRVRRHLEGRIQLLARRALQVAAREAVANEATLSQEAPQPNTVAVLPFHYGGANPEIKPLERGLAQLFVTDLSGISALTLLERERMQQLLDELRLTAQGLADPFTAARPGRLLRAARVLQGIIDDGPGEGTLRLEASVVNTSTTAIDATASGREPLDQLFDLEKAALFALIDRLGIPLTLAEREQLAERPTASLQAFLAYSRGLEAGDRADWAGAAAEFRAAARLDPSFRDARRRQAESAAMSAAAALTPVRVARLLDRSAESNFLADNLNRVMPSGMEIVDRVQIPRETQPPGGRDPLGDVGGEDRVQPPTGYGAIEIKVKRP